MGITVTEAFEGLIDPSGDDAANFAAEFEADRRRRPSTRELVEGVVERMSEVHERAELEAKLAEELPPDPLDELDPDVEVVPPEEQE